MTQYRTKRHVMQREPVEVSLTGETRIGILCGMENKIRFDQLASRMLRAARLDPSLYEEIEHDRSASAQATIIVLLSGLAAGLGSIGQFGGYGHVIPAMFWAVLGWLIWAALIYWIGTRLLPESQTEANKGQLLRTIGFASTPGLLRVLGILPGLTGLVFFVSAVWMLFAMVIAVRQALDYRSTGRAIGVCLIGWFVQALVLFFAIAIGAP